MTKKQCLSYVSANLLLGLGLVFSGCGGEPAGSPSSGTGGVDAGGVDAPDGKSSGTGGGPSNGSGGAAETGGASGATGGSVGSGGNATGSGGVAGDTGSGGATGSGGTGGGGEPMSGGRTGSAGRGDAGAGGRALGGAPGSAGRSAQGGSPGTGTAGVGSGGAAAGGAGGNITIWLAGDSTVAKGSAPCAGWGQVFDPFFDSRVTVTDSAVGGTSLHTWLYDVGSSKDPATGECTLTKDASGQPVVQARWQDMLDHMKGGDYLFIQFGINDGGDCPRYEGDAQFKTTLGMMAMAAKMRGANPVFVTPVSSIKCQGSSAIPTRGRFVTDTKTAGMTYAVPVIDLEGLSVALYNANNFCPLPGGMSDVSDSTGGAVGAFFCHDHTHFEMAGAMSIAKTMADAVRAQLPGLAAYLK